MREKFKKMYRRLFNSKKTTEKDYKNSEEVIKKRLEQLKKK